MNLLNLTCDNLIEQFRKKYKRGKYHAAAYYRTFYNTANNKPAQMPEFSNVPILLRQIQNDFVASCPPVVKRISEDGVTKMVFQLEDGHTVETVVIPMANHNTVCISCQVGCRMGCRICQTGQAGLIRNLKVEEIVAQVYTVKVKMKIKVRNVVMMGMGEPLDNFDAVIQAVGVMEDQRGLDIAKRHITISTAGLPDKIIQLARLNWPQLKLALSLNAPNDELRTKLMPINRHYPMDCLKQVLATYPLARGNALFIENVLIKGVNDHSEYACHLANYFDGLPVKLNLIPYNPGPHSPFQAPTDEDVHRFHQALIDQNIFVRRRSTKGAGIRAACGQLGGKTKNNRTNTLT